MITNTEDDCMVPDQKDYKSHWNQAYEKSPTEKLGWYEKHSEPNLALIEELHLTKDAAILNVGSGSSTLIDDLLKLNYTNLIASDISSEALSILKSRLENENDKVKYLIDDLTRPTILSKLKDIDLWNDRAVLHFFVNEKDRKSYSTLVQSSVKKGGFVIISAFAKEGAKKCCSLDVVNYNVPMIQEVLGADFEVQKWFHYTFTNPNGDPRPYIYTLFKRIAA